MVDGSTLDRLVLLERNAGVARLTINRHAKRNALSLEVISQLLSNLEKVEGDSSIRALILTGAGDRTFAAGADLDELPEMLASAASARDYDGKVTQLYRALEKSRLPIIARIAGSAIGGGCLLALACDLRIAASHIKVGFPAAQIGLMLGQHEYELLLDQLSPAQAKHLLFTGQRLTASEAAAIGLINQVVAADDLDAAVNTLADTIVRGAPLAIAASKRILGALRRRRGLERAVEQGFQTIYPSRDLTEGLAAIKDRRPPAFVGK